MSRVMWKGAVSFGLLHAPVSLHPASQQDEIDFDWLRRGSLQPVGYKRVVKETGEEVGKEDIVKAVKYEDRYVVLSDEEIQAANVKSTHTIDIVGFTDAEDVNFLFFETPYYLAPGKGGEKVYALLREALLKTKKIGIALIVMHNKQHLAALIATPHALVLNTLRWATEVRSPDDLDLPEEGQKSVALKPKELQMATQLINNMSEDWQPAQYKDTFRDDIMALVKRKVEEGRAEEISETKAEYPEEHSTEEDLAELLRRSLQGSAHRHGVPKPVPPAARKAAHARTRTPKSTPKTAH
ncbi:MAG TPA: Ku protein [Noviherbaspirillum sp.]|uniref:non-homologous end joining protein Ku n=1 Tax=Noviherbaspirillum sp. TaxID=1926288 RepID=UPI002B4699AB|nr:Ku protein [Noviherbaspirillum sp.]HJV87508.1 Ku protein [Noviherbaspirillum sp.]